MFLRRLLQLTIFKLVHRLRGLIDLSCHRRSEQLKSDVNKEELRLFHTLDTALKLLAVSEQCGRIQFYH